MVDTRPAVPLTNAQLLVVATRNLLGWGLFLVGALTPVMLLSTNPIINAFSASHANDEVHGKGWMLVVAWIIFGLTCVGYGFANDLIESLKSSRTIIAYVCIAVVPTVGIIMPSTSAYSVGLLLIVIQVPCAVLSMIATNHLVRAKQKTGRGSASALFAIGLTVSYLIASQIAASTTMSTAVTLGAVVSAAVMIFGLLINLWLKRHPGKPVRHRISRHDKKKLKINYFVRFLITNVIFYTGAYGIQYNLTPLANANSSKKGVSLDQVVSSSISLYTVGSLAAILGTVFFLFATERIERSYLVGAITFGISSLMIVSLAKASIFVLVQFISGIGVGITSTTLLVLTITYVPKKAWRGRAVGLLFASLALAHAAGPIVSHFLIIGANEANFTALLMTSAIGSCVTAGILHVTRAKPNDFHVSM